MSTHVDTTESPPELLYETEGSIAILTLNRPAQRNALSSQLMALLQKQLADIHENRDINVVVLRAHGPAFCAGHDLKELRAARTPGDRPDEAFFSRLFQQCSDLMLAIIRLRQPVIAEVHAMATAAGCQLVASCDLAVAAETARFATPGVNIGLFCSTPMVAVSRNMPRKQVLEMLLTGDPIDAQTALNHGLVNRVVASEDLHDSTMALARQIAGKSPYVLEIGKQAYYLQLERGIADAYDYCAAVMTRNMLARDAEEGIDAFVTKRQPVWRGE